jgi:hypothetical protein
MLFAQSAGMSADYGSLFFFGPLWVAIAVWLVIALTFDYLRRIRERQMASEIVQSMLANPKNSAEDIERVLTGWWGGGKRAAKAAAKAATKALKEHSYYDVAAAGAKPVKTSV